MSEQTMQKGLLIAGGLLGLGLLGYVLFRDKEQTVEDAEFTIVEESKSEKEDKPIPVKKVIPVVEIKPIVSLEKEKKAIVNKPEVLPEPNDDFPLKLGSKGERVYQLRVYLLKNHGAAKGIITDEFDAITEERVLRLYKVKEVSEQLFNERKMGKIKKQQKDGRKEKH
ncbi:hypothetical protein [Winogradskyella schleiferi]|uniref:hypothetical protein n=1 Tax=Winogradskyella schleiferi TaxID=2686078 RepID=UPI0015BAB3B1|nr:hypothetical protein [Winogradskyella schleiferi]